MRILITDPASPGTPSGNRETARQWKELFIKLGHSCSIITPELTPLPDSDWLLAIHAHKSHAALQQFKKIHPQRKTMVAVTGTDINRPDVSAETRDSLELADIILTLHDKMVDRIPEALRSKIRTIVQSVQPLHQPPERSTDAFNVCVVGNLREVKDPMRAAIATRALPRNSTIQLTHIGSILEPAFEVQVAQEQQKNARYTWVGSRTPHETRHLIAQSHALVHSSIEEGGPRVIGEACSLGTPILGSRIDGITGLLGDDYPGLFDVGDAAQLTTLMLKAEGHPDFFQDLKGALKKIAYRFSPETEQHAWEKLFAEPTCNSDQR